MKNRETQRAVKNILHNELGITSEKVEKLITDYIDKKFNERLDQFMNSKTFEYKVQERINSSLGPIVREAMAGQLRNISVNVVVK